MEQKKRLIDANALLDKLERLVDLCNPRGYVFSANGIAEEIGNAPTVDAVEVVRCKDCKHYEDHKRKIYENCVRNERLIPMLPNDFCSYGERREGE